MKVCILTLGCKVNYYESEVIKGLFINNGYKSSELEDNPDVIVINTCTVTNQSDAKSRKVIRNAKRKNPNAIIVACGCSSQHHKEELLPLGIDILIGNKDKTKIVDYVNEFKKNKTQIVKFYDLMKTDFENMEIQNYYERTRAFVKIQDGCNNYCAYCIIPYMRGTIRNKDFKTAVSEIKNLTEEGFKEIVLTGIHTGSYPRLSELIHEISKFDKLERIRISSIEITEINDEFLNELKNNTKICNHLHIPIQSGSDEVLKKMNRKYDIKRYLEIVKSIRNIRPDINLTTDLIVGFPTETEDNCTETIMNLKKIGFGKIHTFPYSKRDGTIAAKMKNIVSDTEKTKRTHIILNLSDELEGKYYKQFLNKNLDVLIEEIGPDYSIGHTSNYIKVIINEKLKHNEIYNCKIKEVNGICVKGIVNK
jgi:threonylcarbamoyladenosine tRNA methylthiotransferase MtaB